MVHMVQMVLKGPSIMTNECYFRFDAVIVCLPYPIALVNIFILVKILQRPKKKKLPGLSRGISLGIS